MKILSVIPSANPKAGGPIQGIRYYQSTLVQLGCSRDIVTFEDSNDVIDWDFPVTLKVHSLGKVNNPFSYNALFFPFLKNNLSNYDVVIIHGLWLYHSICTFLAFKLIQKNNPNLKLPQLYCMPHGMLDPWFQKEKTRKIKAIRNYIYWHLFEKHVINHVDGILFTCEQELLLARTTFSCYRPKKEINIGYGIETPPKNNLIFKNAFEDLCPSIKGEHFLLFLSRIDIKKGVDLLINSYNRMSQDYLVLPHLVIAGPLTSNYAKEMILLAAGNHKIHFPGMLRGHEKWGALYGCDAFILPSHQENFGISVAEALACSKPVLISNKVNIYKEIEAGGAGIINQDNLEGTIANLKLWIDLSATEKQKMSEAANRVYITNFNVNNAAINLYNLIKLNTN